MWWKGIRLCFVCIFVLGTIYNADGFNINTDTVYRQFGGNDDSYFGYALAFIDNNWLLVGAPRDNDTLIPSVKEPGQLWRCDLRKFDPGACAPFSVDNMTASDRAGTTYFKHGRDNAWLGATIDVPLEDPNKGIVVCSPRWYNRQHAGQYFMNGLCYAIPIDLNTANIEKFPVLVSAVNQGQTVGGETKVYYSMAAMGMALHYTQSNRDLLMGTPGLFDWTGGFVRRNVRNNFAIMNSSFERIDDTAHQYLGLAITSGKYFLDNQEYFVFGAPRWDLVGKVYFFKGDQQDYILANVSLELSGLDGHEQELPMNSYFGACLCTADVNADGYDDILVGAPLYGNVSALDDENQGDKIDVGRVYLYLGKKNLIDFNNTVYTFVGDSKPRARFGSAISSLGDINKDGYNDVAIGAPYEDEQRGVVYIYNGYREGLWAMYSQKIVARQLNNGLRAFGYTISKPMDVNSDDVNDVAIGSYMSSHVTVLLGQPVINMNAAMMVTEDSIDDLDVIDKNSNTTYVKVCFKYFHQRCSRVSLNVTLTLDVEKGHLSRLYFKTNRGSSLTFQLSAFSSDISCSNSDIGKLFVKPTFDLLSPIVILMQYEMTSNTCPVDSVPTISKFDGNSPGDPLLELRKKLKLKNECPNNNCTSDLHLDVEASYENVTGFFVVGTPKLTLHVNITKSGDPSYGSLFRTTIPNAILYRTQEQTSGTAVVKCSLENSIDESGSSIEKYKNESVLECSFGNPMVEDIGVTFDLFFKVPNSISSDAIDFRMEATTLSHDVNMKDNYKPLEIKMKNHVEAALSGLTDPDTLLVQQQTETYDIRHVYALENRGPSMLPTASIHIAYPQIQSHRSASLYLNQTQIRCGKPCEVECTMNGDTQVPLVWEINRGRHKYVNKRTDGTELTPSRNLNCEDGSCLTYSCTLLNLPPLQSVSVELNFVVLKQVEGILESEKSIEITSKADVRLNAVNLISNTTRLQHTVKTTILPRVPPKTGVQWWIIVVSVLCGLIIIALMIFILYKVGFFKRKRVPQARPRLEMEKEKEKPFNEKESVSLTDSDNDIIDKNGK